MRCKNCQKEMKEIVNVLNLLEADSLPEPPVEVWNEIQENVVSLGEKTMVFPSGQSIPFFLRYGFYFSSLAAIILFIFLLFSPFKNSSQENTAMLWTFFHTDLWDFSGFFGKVENSKLPVFATEIEQKFKLRLKKELDLNTQDESKLFPLLKNFSSKMREYCYSYGYALSALSLAVEQDKKNELDRWLYQLHIIREKWTNSRWELLKEVRLLLNEKQFARFLLFTERLPAEIKNICGEAWETKS
ncbi:MAG: hypothetical protein HUU50_21735 [Candidatus Brocadiae bacterium]|nr:hypothetical protein [Candidatus Brocadiia bacterium]